MKGFLDFVREQGVVGLAVGFILGGAISQAVTSLVDNLINPLLSVALGRAQLEDRVWILREATTNNEQIAIGWGALLSVLINFIIIAAVVYFGVKGLGLDKLDKAKK